MQLKKVTVTGADDSVSPEDLVTISERYPFVEWGILLSKSSGGRCRFPSDDWIQRFFDHVNACRRFKRINMNVSGHLCGSWVRDFCKGTPSFIEDFKWHMEFDRYQLNFHAITHKIEKPGFIKMLKKFPYKQFIFQFDDVNNDLINTAFDNNVAAAPLFDTSGGIGLLPGTWPESDYYAGYAGGLSPENVVEQLGKIEKVAKRHIWIDAETRLRSDNDQQFDLDKVNAFLEAAKPWVKS